MAATTNRLFIEHNDLFKKACELAGLPPTVRQASKFRNNKGRAIHEIVAAKRELEKLDTGKL